MQSWVLGYTVGLNSERALVAISGARESRILKLEACEEAKRPYHTMARAESSKAAASNGLKPSTNGAPANYELPWYVESDVA